MRYANKINTTTKIIINSKIKVIIYGNEQKFGLSAKN